MGEGIACTKVRGENGAVILSNCIAVDTPLESGARGYSRYAS